MGIDKRDRQMIELPDEVLDALSGDVVKPLFFVRVEFENISVLMNTSGISYRWDVGDGSGEQEWLAAGWGGGPLRRLELPTINADGNSSRLGMQLSVVSGGSDIVQAVLRQKYNRAPVFVYFGCAGEDDKLITADGADGSAKFPFLYWRGFGESLSLEVEIDERLRRTVVVDFSALSVLGAWDAAAGRVYNGDDQRRRYPSDRAFDNVNINQQYWY